MTNKPMTEIEAIRQNSILRLSLNLIYALTEEMNLIAIKRTIELTATELDKFNTRDFSPTIINKPLDSNE